MRGSRGIEQGRLQIPFPFFTGLPVGYEIPGKSAQSISENEKETTLNTKR
jgi:hypothetical protein